jgi:anti-sigma B factor antagonist
MKIRQREIQDVVVLDVTGQLLGGPDVEVFRDTVRALVAAGRRKVLVNLESVAWINSTGLGALIDGFTTLHKSGGRLKLVGVPPRVQSVLSVTKLSTIFESYGQEDDAIRSFA